MAENTAKKLDTAEEAVDAAVGDPTAAKVGQAQEAVTDAQEAVGDAGYSYKGDQWQESLTRLQQTLDNLPETLNTTMKTFYSNQEAGTEGPESEATELTIQTDLADQTPDQTPGQNYLSDVEDLPAVQTSQKGRKRSFKLKRKG